MESTAAPGQIHVTAAVEKILREDFVFEPLPEQEIKISVNSAPLGEAIPRKRQSPGQNALPGFSQVQC
jgi:hypothetical protein